MVSRYAVIGLTVLWGTSTALASLGAQGANAPDIRSVRQGVYSNAQAERGAAAYSRSCAMCHKPDLQGNPDSEVPALAGDEFLVPWEMSTVGDLVARLSRTMPGNRPGSLSRAEYIDIVAHILKSNRFPDGESELPEDANALSRIVFKRD